MEQRVVEGLSAKARLICDYEKRFYANTGFAKDGVEYSSDATTESHKERCPPALHGTIQIMAPKIGGSANLLTQEWCGKFKDLKRHVTQRMDQISKAQSRMHDSIESLQFMLDKVDGKLVDCASTGPWSNAHSKSDGGGRENSSDGQGGDVAHGVRTRPLFFQTTVITPRTHVEPSSWQQQQQQHSPTILYLSPLIQASAVANGVSGGAASDNHAKGLYDTQLEN